MTRAHNRMFIKHTYQIKRRRRHRKDAADQYARRGGGGGGGAGDESPSVCARALICFRAN